MATGKYAKSIVGKSIELPHQLQAISKFVALIIPLNFYHRAIRGCGRKPKCPTQRRVSLPVGLSSLEFGCHNSLPADTHSKASFLGMRALSTSQSHATLHSTKWIPNSNKHPANKMNFKGRETAPYTVVVFLCTLLV